MKIYLTISLRTAENYGSSIRLLVDELKDQGHKVYLRKFKKPDSSLAARVKSAEGLLDVIDKEISDVYRETLKRIRECDVVITEASIASTGVGYEVAMAQNEKKPILALRRKDAPNTIADVYSGNTYNLFTIKTYSKDEEMLTITKEFLKDAKDKVDTKFILIISPEIDKYLGWASEEKRLHKAQIVRTAVEDMMTKDKDYQAFLKSLE